MRLENKKGGLADHSIIRVLAPLCGKPPFALEGVIRLLSTSSLEVHFPPEKFPVQDLDNEGEWDVSWEQGDFFLTAKARMARLIDGNRVLLDITEIFFHQCTRRLFRVDAGVYLHYWPADQGDTPDHPPVRKKVNISGCGIRFEVSEPLAEDRQVALEITLPGATLEMVRCLGRVVRTEKKENGAYEVALEMVQIPNRDLDKIMTFCMAEQFKKMHAKVKAMGAILSPSLEKSAPPAPELEDLPEEEKSVLS